jgi:hypothetical protein
MTTPTPARVETEIESLRHDVTCWFARNDIPAIRAVFDAALKALPTEHETIIDRNGTMRVFHVIPDDVQRDFFTAWHAELDGMIAMMDKHSHE